MCGAVKAKLTHNFCINLCIGKLSMQKLVCDNLLKGREGRVTRLCRFTASMGAFMTFVRGVMRKLGGNYMFVAWAA